MYKAILFDFDGVILESVDLKGQGFSLLYQNYGNEAARYAEEYHRQHGGVSRFEKIHHFNERFGISTELKMIESMARQFSQIILEKMKSCPFVPGALEFLEKWSSRIPLYVISATPEEELKNIIQLRELDRHFKESFGSPQGKKEHIEFILSKENWSPSEVLFVGDASTDLKASQATQVPFLGRLTPGLASPFPADVRASKDVFTQLESLL